MEPAHSTPTASPHPRAPLAGCLDQVIAQRLDHGDRQALRAAWARDPRRASRRPDRRGRPRPRTRPGPRLGRPVPTRPGGTSRVPPARDRSRAARWWRRSTANHTGALRAAWASLGDGSGAGLLPGGAHHPLWGASDRLVRLASSGVSTTTLTLAGAVRWSAVDTIPPVAEPGRLPAGAGAAILNVLAALAWAHQGRPPLRYRGPYPTEQLFWSLTESFHLEPPRPSDPLARFLADAELDVRASGPPGGDASGLAARPARAAPPPRRARRPAPGRRRADRVARPPLPPDRLPGAAPAGAPGRAPRRGRGRSAPLRCVARGPRSVVVEDHLVLDDRGEPLERCPPAPDPAREAPLAAPWRDALVLSAPRGDAAPRRCDRRRMARAPARVGVVPGDLVEARGTTLRLSPKLARVYRSALPARRREGGGRWRSAWSRDPRPDRPAVRDAAVGWLVRLNPHGKRPSSRRPPSADRVTLAGRLRNPSGACWTRWSWGRRCRSDGGRLGGRERPGPAQLHVGGGGGGGGFGPTRPGDAYVPVREGA